MELDILDIVKGHLKSGDEWTFLGADGSNDENITTATTVSFSKQNNNDEKENFNLDTNTNFEIDGTKIPLRIIMHCWEHKNSSAADYLADCQAKQLTSISFLQRTDLINWLTGKQEESEYIKSGSAAMTTSDTSLKEDSDILIKKAYNESEKQIEHTPNESARSIEIDIASVDPVLSETLKHERPLIDHNYSLRGSKPIDFGYLIKDSELKLVQSIKSSLRSKGSKGQPNGVSKSAAIKRNAIQRKDPIILIPSAASSILTINNIKQFLGNSEYISSRQLPSSTLNDDLVTIEKKFDGLSRPIRFLIVNNTRMFTKPEYWDRVVAVVTTGHTWQFNNYQWNTPQQLFQHCKGYYFHFTGDGVPQHVQQWNVQPVELDKNRRFKDIEVVRFFWNTLEKELIARGYQ